MLEKIFSTFHSCNIILQQQYRQLEFKTYLELISMLLTTKQTNELLLKNHDSRLIGTSAIFEAHVSSNKSSNYFKGREQRQDHNFRKGDGRFKLNNRNNPWQQRNDLVVQCDKGMKPIRKHEDVHNLCGLIGHWVHTYYTQKHFISLYQASLKDKDKKVETHSVGNTFGEANV